MKKYWDSEELIEIFTLTKEELEIFKKKSDETKLGFAILFKFFQSEGRFPVHKNEVPKNVIKYLSRQLKIKAITFSFGSEKQKNKIPVFVLVAGLVISHG